MSELEQSQLDAIGLGLVGVGVFFSFVFYFGWDGGRVGQLLADAFVFFLGKVAYLVPLSLLVAGAVLVLKPFLPAVTPFKAGGALLLAALALGFAAGSYGLGPDQPVRDGFFHSDYFMHHGGLVGEILYFVISTFFQRVGAHLAFTFMFLSGLLLLTGASIASVMRATGGAFTDAVGRARAQTQDFARMVAGERAATPGAGTTEHAAPTLGGGVFAEPEGEPEIRVLEDDEDDEEEPLADPLEIEAERIEAGGAVAADEQVEAIELTPQGARRSPVTESDQLRYRVPDPGFLKRSGAAKALDTSNEEQVGELLIETLGHFDVEARVVGRVTGPRVTRYELSLAPGTKVSKVSQLKDDLAYALASTDLRILAPIPGKQAVGVEVPNQLSRVVHLGDIFRRKIANGGSTRAAAGGVSPLAVWLGKDIGGNAIWTDLARMPHLLVAGTTGAGKSGCINTMLSSILLRSSPNEVRMVLVDPKRVELNYYEDIPHLLTPVVTVPRMAANVLANLIREMENRYEVTGEARCRNIIELNRARTAAKERPLPYIVCVIDELADLMMVAPGEVEDSIVRLAQKSRAVGIHLVLATQRPSVDVITGTIKVNVPARISFAVSSHHDSRVILDQVGAETLLGQGDMLFRPVGSSKLQRVQGAYITEEEIAQLVETWRVQGEPAYEEELLQGPDPEESESEFSPDEDDLLRDAIELVAQTQTASVSMLQRRLRVGYTRAGRLIDMLERRGVISGYEGSKPRQVLISEADVARVLSPGGEAHPEPALAAGSRIESEAGDDA
jgi:DNA segregation ATPase FtsK/SpoIIIE, S-DNA-T family